jgi:predicted MFS family arabinose efflux permease
VSGLIAEVAGWRAVYWVATVVAAVLALVLARALPADASRPSVRYRTLLRGTVSLMTTQPVLRRRALLGALGFAAFSAFWTSVAFLLSAPPFDYGDGVIGLFGLIGAAGALAAVFAGRLADQGRSAITTTAFAAMVLGSFVVLWFGRGNVAALVVGILLLDLGVQGLQVTNQSVIYALVPDARSQVTSAYMVSYFVGGAIGSAAGGALYDMHGWAGVCAFGVALGAAASLVSVARGTRRGQPRVDSAVTTVASSTPTEAP